MFDAAWMKVGDVPPQAAGLLLTNTLNKIIYTPKGPLTFIWTK